MFGTAGGHVHANGLAIELYGAGLIAGADPGRGSSYWQADHAEYYSQPPAHNTVIVNGKSTYRVGRGQIAMDLEVIEPASGAAALSPNFTFAQAAFRYPDPEARQPHTWPWFAPANGAGFISTCSAPGHNPRRISFTIIFITISASRSRFAMPPENRWPWRRAICWDRGTGH